MKNLSLALMLAAVFIAGCSKESEKSLWSKVESSRANKNPDSTLLVCRKILEDYPQGKLAPGALYMIAEVYYYDKHDPYTATGYYRQFIAKYPDLEQTPVAMFLIGFIYNNDLGRMDSAKLGYEHFLYKYPDHQLAPSARMELSNLGKSPDQILMETQPKVKPGKGK